MSNLLKTKLAVAIALSALGATQFAVAQPQAGTAPTTKIKGKRGTRKVKGGISAKMQAKIEAALGHPLTADQKAQLNAVADTHRVAVKAADADYQSAVSRITGLSVAQIKGSHTQPATPKA